MTAGALSYVGGIVDQTMGIEKVEYKNLSNLQKVTKGVVNTTIRSGVNSVVYGIDFEDSLKYGLATGAINLGFEYIGDTSMFKQLYENNEYFSEGAIGKVALHGLAGGIGAELVGGDFEVGAASAAVRELISPLTSDQSKTIQLAISQLSGTLVGAALNGDKGATTGYHIATSAELNNRQLHEDEIKFIKENAKNYAKEKFGTDNPSEKQIQLAKQSLTQTGMRRTDTFWSNNYEEDKEAKAFIEENADSSLFQATQIEKDNFMQNIGTFYKNADLYKTIEKDKTILGITIGKTNAIEGANIKTILEIAKGNNAQEGAKALVNAAISAYKNGDKEEGRDYLDALASAYSLGGNSAVGSFIDLAKNADDPVATLTELLTTKLIGGMIIKGVGTKNVGKELKGNKTPVNVQNNKLPEKHSNRTDVKKYSAEEINTKHFNDANYKPPYKKGTQVVEYTTKKDDVFVRVHGNKNRTGSWIMKKEAIEGLTAKQIQKKYSLPSTPTFISDVHVPAGSKIRTGKVASNFENQGGGGQGATQYEWVSNKKLPKAAFKNKRSIK